MTNIEQQLQEFRSSVMSNPSPRGMAMLIEANQAYADYLDFLLTVPKEFHTEITITVEEKTIRFKDVEGFSSWLEEVNAKFNS